MKSLRLLCSGTLGATNFSVVIIFEFLISNLLNRFVKKQKASDRA